MDKRAAILALDARRRIIEARREAGVKLSDVKRAVNAELRQIRAAVPSEEEIAARVLERIQLPQVPEVRDGRDGRDGKDGRDVTEEQIAAAVAEYMRKNPRKAGKEQSLLRLRHMAPTTVNTGSALVKVVTKEENYTLTAGDAVVLVNAAGGARTVTLQDAAAFITNSESVKWYVKKTDNSANAVTIQTNTAGQLIEGRASISLDSQYDAAEIVTDGSHYYIL